MNNNFHQTGYGRDFFGYQLPRLIKALERLADAAEGSNKSISFSNKLPFKKALPLSWEEVSKIVSEELKAILGHPIDCVANYDDVGYWAVKINDMRIPSEEMSKALDLLKADEYQREDMLPLSDERHLGVNEIGMEGGNLLLENYLGYKWETMHIEEDRIWLLGDKSEVPNEN